MDGGELGLTPAPARTGVEKQRGSVRETIATDGPDGEMYLLRYKWDKTKSSIVSHWTTDINKAKIWNYSGIAAAWIKARGMLAILGGYSVCNARAVKGWVEK